MTTIDPPRHTRNAGRAKPWWRAALSLPMWAAALGAVAEEPKDPYRPDEILLRLRSAQALNQVLTTYQLSLIAQSGRRPIYRLLVQDGSPVPDKVAQIARDPDVISAEANFEPRSPEGRKNVVWAIGTEAEYHAQWAPVAMRLAQAQAITQGAGMRVAVLDTGVDLTHPALAGKLLPGRDFVDNDSDPSEEGSIGDLGFGHGTHVAGLVALTAPGAKIIPIRVLDQDGRGDLWALQAAILYAMNPDGDPDTDDGAHVINMSLGTLDRTQIVDDVMPLASCAIPKRNNAQPDTDYTDEGYDDDKLRCRARRGAVLFAAAGNDGSRQIKQYPGAEDEDEMLSPVGASAEDNRFATFSNMGNWVELAAPGDKITSTVPGGGYGTWSGTSMSTPLVSGVAALMLSKSPKLKTSALIRRLKSTGADLCGSDEAVLLDALGAVTNKRAPPLDCR